MKTNLSDLGKQALCYHPISNAVWEKRNGERKNRNAVLLRGNGVPDLLCECLVFRFWESRWLFCRLSEIRTAIRRCPNCPSVFSSQEICDFLPFLWKWRTCRLFPDTCILGLSSRKECVVLWVAVLSLL